MKTEKQKFAEKVIRRYQGTIEYSSPLQVLARFNNSSDMQSAFYRLVQQHRLDAFAVDLRLEVFFE